MKIKIKATDEIVDAIITHDNVAKFINYANCISNLYENEYEIIPEPPRPKFKISDVVGIGLSGKGMFAIDKIIIQSDGFHYGCTQTGKEYHEHQLTLYTEPEKPKTEIRYQFIFKPQTARPFISDTLFLNDEEASEHLSEGNYKWFRKIDVPLECQI